MHIQETSVEIDRIHSLLSEKDIRSIAVTSSNSGEGVTSMAMALAQHSLLAGYSTLLIDLNIYRPSIQSALKLNDIASEPSLFNQPELVCLENTSIVTTGISAPTKRATIMKLRQRGVLEQCIREWQKSFDRIIIDTSPLNRVNANNISPERVAAACDGCLVVVLAGSTTESMIVSAIEKLNSTSAHIIGCVLNDRDNPSLKNELIRETQRLRPHFNWLANHLEAWLSKNNFLDLEV
jgi:Mrp family chromosome partitioning ATPase